MQCKGSSVVLTSGYNILDMSMIPSNFFGIPSYFPPQTDSKTFNELVEIERLWDYISPGEVESFGGISPAVKVLSKKGTHVIYVSCNDLLPEKVLSVPRELFGEIAGYPNTGHLKTTVWIPKTKKEVRYLILSQYADRLSF